MQFTFDGNLPKIWLDNCNNYFTIYNTEEGMKVTYATMHLQDNAAKWWQAYKQGHTWSSWTAFSSIVLSKFGADDFRNAINDLLAIKQSGTVEEYTVAFQAL
jgi:hypothetical protein